MKPLNINTHGCDPVSSNCVIWQGPDIPCLKLCKGDSVSDVVYKLATELCEVLEILDVSTYNLPDSCFQNQQCSPSDFQDLIQIIIDKICALETSVAASGERTAVVSGTCPDCVLNIPTCFQYTNEFGDLVTTMQLTDFVRTIANKVCNLINQINNLTVIVANHEERITALENTPDPTVSLPQVTPTCILTPAVPTDMAFFLSVLEQQFCELSTATGSPNALQQAIIKQCLNLNNSPALGTSGGNMSAIVGWINNVNNLASAINNIWLTICDLRSAVRNIQINCCPSGCDGIEIVMVASLTGPTLTVYFSGTIPSGFDECSPLGNTFKITDSLGASITTTIDTINYLNAPGGFPINIGSTPLSLVADMTITSDVCYTNSSTGNTCQFCLTYTLINQSNCPQLFISSAPLGDGITVTFNPTAVPGTYTVEVWNSTITAVITTQSQLLNVYGPAVYNISGLSPATTYNVRLLITQGDKTTTCGYSVITTAPTVCIPPTSVVAEISYPVECTTCGEALEFVSNPVEGDGWYVDDNSQFLYLRSGGVFNTIIEEEAIQAAGCIVGCGLYSQATTIAAGQYVVRTNNADPADRRIYIYDAGSTQTLVQTINLTSPAAALGIAYNPNDNCIYFTGDYAFANYNVSRINLNNVPAATVEYNILGNVNFPIIATLSYCLVNEVTNQLWVVGGGGAQQYVQVVDLATDTLVPAGVNMPITSTTTGDSATWGGAYGITQMEFDSAGNAWFSMSNSTGANNDLIVVDGTTYAPLTLINDSASYPDPGAGSVIGRNITYYPGDGTPGSDRMFVLMANGDIDTYLTIAPYTQTVYGTIVPGGIDSILYSKLFDKLILINGSNVTVYDPQNIANTYGTITISGGGNMMRPYELTPYNEILVPKVGTDIAYLGLDEDNIEFCSEGVVKMYLSNEGPYQWNSTTNSWDSLSTTTVAYATPGASQFTVTAILDGSVVTAALLISTDYGFSWQPLADSLGNLYANPAAWATGRVYDNPIGTFYVKVTFTTDDECGLEGSIIVPGP
jgi:hypothetical protein